MTDNRTTELREKLTERGIEYTTNDHMGVCETSWNGFTAMQLTPSAKLIMTVTPEQAIAATLGVDVKDCESLLWEFIGALDVADATDADKKPIVSDYARHIASTLGSEREKQLESFVLDMLFAIKIGSMSNLTDRSVLKSWLKDFSERASELGLLEGDDE